MAQYAPTVPRMTRPVFLVVARDRTDGEGAALREQHLDAHLEYVEKHCDDYLICGPVWPPETGAIDGSFFVISAADAAAARALVEGDPYVRAGIYRDVEVMQVAASAGRWIGGVIWESAESVRQFAAKARDAGSS